MTNEANDMTEDTENANPGDETTADYPAADDPAGERGASPEDDDQGGEPINFDGPEILFEGPDRLTELEARVAELNDKLLRAVAETENVRRRAQRDKEDASKYAIAGFAGDMVTVADNLTRALASIDAETRAGNEAVDNLMAGIEMTLRDLLNTFERTGIKQIDAMDKPFDHNLHEAMFEMEDPAKPSGTVIQVVQEGYTLRDRLLRPTKVGVSKGGPMAASPTAEAAAREKAPDQRRAYEQGAPGPGSQVDEEL